MKENLNKNLAFPDLTDCPANAGECALKGCYFENAIARINPEKLGIYKARAVRDKLLEMAIECGCKRANDIPIVHYENLIWDI